MKLPSKRRAAKAALLAFLALTICAPFAHAQLSRMAAGAEVINSLAVTAAIWGAPLVTMFNLRYNDVVGPAAKAAPNSIWREADISTPQVAEEAGYVTPKCEHGLWFRLPRSGVPAAGAERTRFRWALLHGRDRRHVDKRLRLRGRR